ncbi:MAG: hypothetical protein PHC54_07780, partial [Candidatus Omnitrophica bacterium]|nr:hypothetical protein [Candidatus Omnitrophota bacterium]
LIVVIIIVGILAAVGMSQYSLIVEKARTAEARVRIGIMRQLAQEYYLNNATVEGIQWSDLGVDYTCSSTSFYKYVVWQIDAVRLNLCAYRCTSGSGGKTPNSDREYVYWMWFEPSTGKSEWHCSYTGDNAPCFGYPP